jgi:hypothetical protein
MPSLELKITPELRDQDFKFETKKQVTVDGGQREIDIYVTRKAAHGYRTRENRPSTYANLVFMSFFRCRRSAVHSHVSAAIQGKF